MTNDQTQRALNESTECAESVDLSAQSAPLSVISDLEEAR